MRLLRPWLLRPPLRKRLYLDMDGVLLVMLGGAVAPARHAEAFLDFSLANFDLFWLVTHDQGDARDLLDRLDPATAATLRRKLLRVRPARFHIEKSEALSGDFYWLGARVLPTERTRLRQRNQWDRWIEVNTYVRPDDLLRALAHLRARLAGVDLPAAAAPQHPGVAQTESRVS